MNSVYALQEMGVQTGNKTDKASQELGKNDFLNLLVTQLKNQDPLKPSDPTEFTSQLAQYSSLEQLQNISEGMDGLSSMEEEFGRMSALSLIDKQVTAETDKLKFDGEPVEMGFRFSDSVEKATVTIKGSNGQIFDQVEVKQPLDGNNFIQWDGTDQNGQSVPEGEYYIEVAGSTAEGGKIAGTPMVESRVTGVDFSDSESILLTTSGRIPFSEITRVNNSTLAAESQD